MNRFFIALLFSICSLCSNCQQRDYEAELIQYLKNNISNFSPLMRPSLYQSKPTYINMDTALNQLVSVDSAKQSVKITAFMQASWTDERLVWNPRNFGNVSIINWDSAQVWYPVVLVYNGIGDNQLLTPQMPAYLMSLSPNSTRVVAGWRREFEFSCKFDMTRFPLDQHVCELEFFFSDQGHGNQLVLPIKSTFLPFKGTGLYKESSEWKLRNMSTFAERKPYDLLQGIGIVYLPTYVVHLEIERVSTYYFMNIITPLLLLTLLQVLVFFVPLESGEKLGFGITIMLSYTVFLLLLDGILPKSQSMPAIASFITAAMILSTISLLLTSLIMRFHFTPEGTRMPACARAVFVRFLGRLFCVRGAKVGHVTSDVSESSVRKSDGGSAAAVGSDWVMAAHAIERLMVALGVIATAVIIAVFVVKPYA